MRSLLTLEGAERKVELLGSRPLDEGALLRNEPRDDDEEAARLDLVEEFRGVEHLGGKINLFKYGAARLLVEEFALSRALARRLDDRTHAVPSPPQENEFAAARRCHRLHEVPLAGNVRLSILELVPVLRENRRKERELALTVRSPLGARVRHSVSNIRVMRATCSLHDCSYAASASFGNGEKGRISGRSAGRSTLIASAAVLSLP